MIFSLEKALGKKRLKALSRGRRTNLDRSGIDYNSRFIRISAVGYRSAGIIYTYYTTYTHTYIYYALTQMEGRAP